ncbi:MAG: DsbA family protein [Chloroflexota bacterium]
MPLPIDVWSDFVCPYCYAVTFSLKKLEESHDVEIRWHSYELRPQGSLPIPPAYLARIEAERPRLAQSMKEMYGIDLQQGAFGINSRPALIGEKYAQAHKLGTDYHDAINHAYWLEGRSIDDRAVLREIAIGLGMEAAAFLAALDDPHYQAQVDADIQQAVEYGLSGVPALIFEQKYLVSGARPYEFLAEVVEQLQQV